MRPLPAAGGEPVAWYGILEASPLGPVFAGGSDAGVHRIDFLGAGRSLDGELALLEREAGEPAARDPEAARPALEALAAWFADAARWPELPLAPRGTPFQLRVWERLRAIPRGGTAYIRICIHILYYMHIQSYIPTYICTHSAYRHA